MENSPRLPRMPWYPRDFLASTQGWTFDQRAIYRALLDVQWDVGSLPDDEAALRRLLDVSPARWRKAWPTVSPKFRRDEDGRLRNPRLEEHRVDAIAIYDSRRKGAAKTNQKRWGKVVPMHGQGGGDGDR